MDIPHTIYSIAIMVVMLSCAIGLVLALLATIGYIAVRSFVRRPVENDHQGWVDALQIVKHGTLFGALVTTLAMFVAGMTTDSWTIRFGIVVVAVFTVAFLLIAYEAIRWIRIRLEPPSELI